MEGGKHMTKTKLIPMTEEEEYRNAGITKKEAKQLTKPLTMEQFRKFVNRCISAKTMGGLDLDLISDFCIDDYYTDSLDPVLVKESAVACAADALNNQCEDLNMPNMFKDF